MSPRDDLFHAARRQRSGHRPDLRADGSRVDARLFGAQGCQFRSRLVLHAGWLRGLSRHRRSGRAAHCGRPDCHGGTLPLWRPLSSGLSSSPCSTEKVERKDEYAIIVTFGLTILLTNLALVVFGPFSKSPPAFLQGTFIAGPLILPYDRLIAAVVAVVLLAALAWFLARTSLGQALDAVSQSRESAAVIGINPKRMYTVAFGLGAALAGGAGALIAPIFALAPNMGELPGVQAFIIIVLGGMGSVSGSIIGGILLGVVQGLGVGFLPDPNRALAYTQAFGALLLIFVLLVRPTGLFGRAHTRLE